MRESRRCASEAESAGGDTGFTVCAIDDPLVFPVWSGDDEGAERNAATMTAATERAVELLGFIGVVRIMGESEKSANNIHGNFN
jgi:hypothetical protein